MQPSWMVQAISMAIYVQTIGAFVWLFLVVLLERGRRSDRARLARLEAFIHEHGRLLAGLASGFSKSTRLADEMYRSQTLELDALRRELNLPALSDRPTATGPADEHEQTDPAFRLPSGIDNPRPESVEVDDEPLGSVAAGHWQCVGCRRTYALCEGHHGKKCFGCGATLELVAYDKPRQNVQLPLPIEASGDK